MTTIKPTMLMILDGFGYRESTQHNAIHHAKTPTWDQLVSQCPTTLIQASGQAVGLPDKQMGNSEVGHMNLGAGRVIYQDLTRIDQAIDNGQFCNEERLTTWLNDYSQSGRPLHCMGLLSPGGVHSHERHLEAMINTAQACGIQQIYVHAFLDGRDTPPKSARASLQAIQSLLEAKQLGRIASICGRYYAMDRDKRWDRVIVAYDMLTAGHAPFRAANCIDALDAAYARGETDEFVQPTCIDDTAPVCLEDGDMLIFTNFRADRAKQLTASLTQDDFTGFDRKQRPALSTCLTMTAYSDDLNTQVIFEKPVIHNVLAEVLAQQGLRQLHVAETEKYAHVTFFFNGGREAPFAHEERRLIASPKVSTYDEQPEMSADEVTTVLTQAIRQNTYDFIVCNYANPDMVGHTGNFDATVKAIECIDGCIAHVVEAIKAVGGQLIITADHGNAEMMFNPETKQPHTAHTSEPIPLLYYGPKRTEVTTDAGVLADVSPTLLYLMGIAQPQEMTGRSLLRVI